MYDSKPVPFGPDHQAVETRAMTPREFTDFVAREIEKWAPLAKRVMGR